MAIGATGIVAGGAASVIARPPPKIAEYFLGIFTRACKLNMDFAEKMPEEHYSFKPVPEIRSYGEQLLHVAGTNAFLVGNYLEAEGAPEIDWEMENPTKEVTIESMKAVDKFAIAAIKGVSDEEMAVVVDTFAGKLSKEEVCWLMRDHMTHTRGQTVIYLRLKGFKPPAYVAV